jgi:hypothetical protein
METIKPKKKTRVLSRKKNETVNFKNLSKTGIWRRTKYVEGEILDMRAVLK